MQIVLEQVLLLLIFAIVGFVLSKTGKADATHAKLISTLEVYLFLPITVFQTFSTKFTVGYIQEKYPLLIVSGIIILVLGVAAFFAAKLITKDAYQRNVITYSLVIPNFSYIGYALAGGIFGPDELLNVMIFGLPFSFYTYTVGYCMLTKSKFSFKKLLNPLMISLVVGAAVGLLGLQLPSLAQTFISKASACTAPLSMVLAGLVISQYPMRSLLTKWRVYLISALRLLVIPCGTALALKLLNLTDMIMPTLMILAMPCGMNTIIFPKMVGEDCETGAAMAFVTILLSVVTIPLCLYIFGLSVL